MRNTLILVRLGANTWPALGDPVVDGIALGIDRTQGQTQRVVGDSSHLAAGT
ncbi:MAG: hypothetical protein R2867_25730 [Caldilineaceae bacterium]